MHPDKVGNQLSAGDEVAYSVGARSTRLEIGLVDGFAAKRVSVNKNGNRTWHSPDRVIKVFRENKDA